MARGVDPSQQNNLSPFSPRSFSDRTYVKRLLFPHSSCRIFAISSLATLSIQSCEFSICPRYHRH